MDYIPSEVEARIMWHYSLLLLWQALTLTISHMGTTALALAAGIVRQFWVFRSRKMSPKTRLSWWSDTKPGIKVTLGIWSVLFLYCFIEAAYDDHLKVGSDRGQLAQKNQELQHELDGLTIPNLSGNIEQVSLSPAGKNNQDTYVIVTAKIKNAGAPSGVQNVSVEFTLPSGRHLPVNPIAKPNQDITAKLENGGTMVVPKDEYLLRKTRIDSGEIAGGFVHGILHGTTIHDLTNPSSTAELGFEDITGKRIVLTHAIGPRPDKSDWYIENLQPK